MTSSVAPTPVIPNTAIAVTRPAGGSLKLQARRRDPATDTAPGGRSSTAAANTVSSVKSPTFTIANRSIRA